jgi:hypothetical protein
MRPALRAPDVVVDVQQLERTVAAHDPAWREAPIRPAVPREALDVFEDAAELMGGCPGCGC